MLYYKIPIAENCFDYFADSILCCAYPVDSYMYCKFESVTDVGSDWVEITESEFDVRCPEFPAPIENEYALISDWDELDILLEKAVSEMVLHSERAYSLNFAIGDPYGAARLTIFKGLNDDGTEESRADLRVTDGHTLHRTAYSEGVDAWIWGEWEWENPPMELRTEYRTIERHNGKPVYAKVVSDELRDGGKTSSMLIASDATEDFQIVSIDAIVKSPQNSFVIGPTCNITMEDAEGTGKYQVWAEVHADVASSGHIATVTIKYTK